MPVTITDATVQAALKTELGEVQDRIAVLLHEVDELREREGALALLMGKATKARPVGGDSLRAAALEYVRREDPKQEGIHYQTIKQALLAAGYVINGYDKGGTVRASIGAGRKATEMFRSLGGGRYTWR